MPKEGTPWFAQTVQLFKNALKNFDEAPDRTIDLQCGKTVWHNVAPKMRTELWLSILHRKGIGSKASKRFREYLSKVGPGFGNSRHCSSAACSLLPADVSCYCSHSQRR